MSYKFVKVLMRFYLLILILLFLKELSAQDRILFVGNHPKICDTIEGKTIEKLSSLPKDLSSYSSIFIFSTANSNIKEETIDTLEAFLEEGKGLYLGSDNWPLVEESNQLTNYWYSKLNWGNFDEEKAEVSKTNEFKWKDSIPAGETTVAFPLDYRLKVEAWINDEPLILSGELNGGKIIIDGGYSRFYCETINEEGKEVLLNMMNFLKP